MSFRMASPWRHPTGTFYLRVIVPTALRDKAKGERLSVTVDGTPRPVRVDSHVKVSLATKDEAEAKRRFVIALAEVESFWSSLRNGPVTLSIAQRRAISEDVHRRFIAEGRDGQGGAEAWAAHRELMARCWEPGVDADQRLATMDLLAGSATDQAVVDRGLRITADSRRDLLGDVAVAMRDVFGLVESAIRWNVSVTAPDAPADPVEPLEAEDLLASFSAERNSSAATIRSYRGKFRQLERILGFDDLRRVTPEHVIQYKAARLAEGTQSGTVTDDILGMGAVCAWAVTNRKLKSNPFTGLAPKGGRSGEPSRHPFDDGETKKMLIAARKEEGWLRWFPWVLCFSGARVSELAELRRRDVRERDGVMILDIVPLAVRPGKNQIAQRMIPVHPALKAEGFLDYVASLPAEPNGPLFPSIPADKHGGRVHPATTASAKWLRKTVGIIDPKKTATHSWRHRLEDELRKVRALPELQDAITGRNNPRNAGAGYGKGFRGMPDEVLKDLQRIPSPVQPLGPMPSP